MSEQVALTPPSSTPAVSTDKQTVPIGELHEPQKPLYEYFGIDKPESGLKDQMADVWEWAKTKAPTDEKDDIIWEIKKLQDRLGTSYGSDMPWSKVVNWVTVHNQMLKSEKRLKEMEGYGQSNTR